MIDPDKDYPKESTGDEKVLYAIRLDMKNVPVIVPVEIIDFQSGRYYYKEPENNQIRRNGNPSVGKDPFMPQTYRSKYNPPGKYFRRSNVGTRFDRCWIFVTRSDAVKRIQCYSDKREIEAEKILEEVASWKVRANKLHIEGAPL